MIRRLLALFDRYAARHLDARRPGAPLRDAAGRVVGAAEEVRLRGSRLLVAGRAEAQRLTLRAGDAAASARPSAARGHRFVLSLRAPAPGTPLALVVEGGDGAAAATPLRAPAPGPARLALLPRFAWALGRAAPDAVCWHRTRDLRHRARVKHLLGLGAELAAPPLEARALAAPGPRPTSRAEPPAGAVTVIVPAYDAFDLLRDCLGRVAAHTDLPWRLVVVEDASPDPRVRPWLRAWAGAQGGRVEVIENAANLGFVGSANLGLARAAAHGGPAVLLNADALVPPGWASRLLAPLADGEVATVTPLSNDAEILSVPALCARLALRPGEAEAMDAAAAALDPLAATAPAPTGVGFCMGLAEGWLRRLPSFDPAFGRGYGEEVDWCQKARESGGVHLATGALFVEHRGGASFGAEKAARVAANNALISRRYPGYDAEVQEFLREDPLAAPRLAVGLAWAAARAGERRVPLYLAHALGGGAELDLRRRVAADLAGDLPSVVLRVGGPQRWQVELHAPSGVAAGTTEDEGLLRRLLAPLGRRRIIYSCGVGDSDPADLPRLLLDLADEADSTVEALLHDYFPLSPSYTLLDAEGAFRGVPAEADPDPAHATRRADGSPVPLAAWRAAWRPLLARAREVTAFSEASRDLFAGAYPDLAGKVAVRPHGMLAEVPAVPRPEGTPRVVGVLGNIGLHKGALVLRDLAAGLPAPGPRGVARLVVVGNVDPALPLPRKVAVHGDYDLADLPALAARYGITDWLIPSVWPETFSFTTREALATGLPTWAFDLGAQGEAVRAAPNGRPLPLGGPRPGRGLARRMAEG